MEIIKKDIDEFKAYNKNAKKHPKEQIKKIAMSIKEFGFRNPILIDKDNNLIAGHGRVLAAKLLKIKTVPCIQIEDMTPQQIKAYRIMDNKSAESEWDYDFLKEDLIDLKEDQFDLELTGFDTEEINQVFGTNEEEAEEDDFDTVKALKEPKYKVKLGDVWHLGNHRLMCGDSTDARQVKALMDGKKADMVFTDPPYNIGYKDLKGNYEKIKNDKMNEDVFLSFLEKTFISYNTSRGYICCNWKYYHLFYRAMSNVGIPCKSCIVWDKINGVQNQDKYFKKHEFILYFGDFGGQKTLRGDVFSLRRERNDLHPTMKPIELCITFIQDSSKKQDIVLDLFGGSGSTLIACEQTDRRCYMMELDPHYISVIVERWEQFTGLKAKKIE